MPLTVYHYPGCSTCKQALAWLAARGLAHTTIDLVKQPPSAATLARIATLAGVERKKLFNVAGESYRAGDFKTRLPTMTAAQAFAALAADGKLIKRPLVLGDDLALVGFSPEVWATRLA